MKARPLAPETSRVGSQYDVTSLGVSGWGGTPYDVSVGGTDFEDVYFAKFNSIPLSTYWNPTNTLGLWLGQAVCSGDSLERCLRQRPDRQLCQRAASRPMAQRPAMCNMSPGQQHHWLPDCRRRQRRREQLRDRTGRREPRQLTAYPARMPGLCANPPSKRERR